MMCIKKLIPAIILCTLSISCQNTNTNSIFSRSEKLIDDNPDSSIILLDELRASYNKLSKAEQMKLELLSARAQNKAYILFSTDSVMQKVCDYYDNHGTMEQKVESHYLLGCSYRDMGDFVQALQCFTDAISFSNDDTELQCLLSRIYAQMSVLYKAQHSPINEFNILQKAIKSALAAGDTLAALNYYDYTSGPLLIMNQLDSALKVCRIAKKEYKRRGMKTDAAYVIPLEVDILLKKNEINNVASLIAEYERESGFFDCHGNIEKGRELFYELKARYYEQTELYDSALFYYSRVLENEQNLDCREAAYKGLTSITKKQKRFSQSVIYAEKYCDANDSSAIKRSSEEINRMNAIYNYNNILKKKEHAELESLKYRIVFLYTLVFLIILGFGLYIYISKRKKEYRKKLQTKNIEYSILINRYETATSELKSLKENTSSAIKRKEEELIKLQTEIKKHNDNIINIYDDERAFLNSPYINNLHKLSCKGVPISQSEIEELLKTTEKEIPIFYHRIINSDKLSGKEKYICLLIRLNFSPSEIATLLNISMQSVTNLRSSINNKLFNKTGAKTLNYNLLRIK